MLDMTVGELLQRLGSSDPAPGGGAAAAVAGALGAALVRMTANLTIGRPRLADVEEEARAIEARAADLCQRLADLADADTAAFDKVSAAYRLPRADDAQKVQRSAAIQSALQGAAAVPLETMRLCAEVVELAEEAAPLLNQAVISDVVVGALLAQAALQAASVNVDINLAAMTDAEAAQRLARAQADARSGAAERLASVVEVGTSRFPKAVQKG